MGTKDRIDFLSVLILSILPILRIMLRPNYSRLRSILPIQELKLVADSSTQDNSGHIPIIRLDIVFAMRKPEFGVVIV